MLKKMRQFLQRYFWQGFSEQKGQSIVIFAASFVGLVAMMGLAIDLGLVYIERVRINKAVDSAVLAAAVELPFEEDAMERAIEYLKNNGYDVGRDVEVVVRGCVTTKGGNIDETHPNGVQQLKMDPVTEVKGAMYIPATETLRASFMIDTGSFRGLQGAENTNDNPANLCEASSGNYGNSARIKIIGKSLVDMNFMKLIGFSKVPVTSEAIAESVSNLDIIVVLDISASMEFDTPCVDCWVKTKAWVADKDMVTYSYPDKNGYYNPIPFAPALVKYERAADKQNNSIPATELCIPQKIVSATLDNVLTNSLETVDYEIPSVVPGAGLPDGSTANYYYSVHEAELYSANMPLEGWNLARRTAGQGYWAVQRGSMANAYEYAGVLDPINYFQGAHRPQEFFQGNQAGNPSQQSANVCNPGIQSGAGGAVIDCTFNGTQICAGDIETKDKDGNQITVKATDCSAYIQAKPFAVYEASANIGVIGGSYDANCFPLNSGNKCWNDSNFVGKPPYVEYDFTNDPNWSAETTIWIRAIGGADLAYEWNGNPNPEAGVDGSGNGPGGRNWWRSAIYWEVLDGDDTNVPMDVVENTDVLPAFAQTNSSNRYPYVRDSRALNSDWQWIKLGTVATPNTDGAGKTQYTLRLYQGSAGYKIDRVLFTNNDAQSITGSDSNAIELKNVVTMNGGRGPQISRGSATREACNLANPIYGFEVTHDDETCIKNGNDGKPGQGKNCTDIPTGQIVNQLNNDLYAGLQPFRSAQEAVKRFAQKLDPKFDQLGFVAFSNDVDNTDVVRSKLQCRNYTARGNGGYNSGDCFIDGINDEKAITFTKVIKAVENQWPLNGTNPAAGMREGLEELGISTPSNPADNGCTSTPNDGHSCSRGDSAKKILILITDGVPTEKPGTASSEYPRPVQGPTDCVTSSQKIWTGSPDDVYHQCAMFYAYQAAQAGVAVYTIGLGAGAPAGFLTTMATGSYQDANGQTYQSAPPFKGLGNFYPAASPLQLDGIFDDILEKIYVDIVG